MSSMSVDFPEPDTPVTATNSPKRNLDVEVAQVVLARALDLRMLRRVIAWPPLRRARRSRAHRGDTGR